MPVLYMYSFTLSQMTSHVIQSIILNRQEMDFVTSWPSWPNDKIVERSKFGHDKINVTKISKFVYGCVKTLCEKGENDGHQHFLFSHIVFKRLYFQDR